MAAITLTITANDRGEVAVNGPIEQLTLCYGLLELAKDVIRREAEARRIMVPAESERRHFGGGR